VTISAGAGITLTPSGNDIAIAASGGAGGLSLLYDSGVLAGNAATIDTGAGGIAGSAKVMRIVAYLRTDQAVQTVAALLTFNADTGNNYDRVAVQGVNVTASANNSVGRANFDGLLATGTSADADSFCGSELTIPQYAGAHHKTLTGTSSAVGTSAAANTLARMTGGRWKSTAAISRAAFALAAGNFVAGSRVTIWGMT
jgi:hypothetical protein